MSLYTVAINSFAFLLVPVVILLIGNKSENIAPIITDMFLYVLITPVIATNVMKVMYLQQDMFLADQAISRVENLTSSEPLPIAENPEKITACDVTFENVSFAYPNAGQNAVDGISFHLPEGLLPLWGNRERKTTIAQLIPRFWDVSAGSVTIGGINVKNIAKDNLMNHIAFVFQNTKLFKTSLLENIKYGNPAASDEAVQRAIDLSQSREIIDRLPNGLNTKIGVDGTFLSGGTATHCLGPGHLERCADCCLDEATAFADPENEHLIQKALHELRKGKTVLMIAHHLTSVQDADKILVIAQGKIAEEGTHSELIARNGIYNSMWNEYQRTVTWTV